MSRAKLVLAGGLTAILLSACGITQKPLVGSGGHIDHAPGSHAKLDDPRKAHKQCLRKLHLGMHYFTTAASYPAIQIGRTGIDPKIVFYPVSPIQNKIDGTAQGGILIGSAIVYPNRARAKIAEEVVKCVDQGVPG